MELSDYDRVTVGLWARSYRQLHGRASAPMPPVPAPASGPIANGAAIPAFLAAAAVHAVLAGLRRCAGPRALFALYADSAATAADFALVDSLVPHTAAGPGDPPDQNEERRWRVRDAAYHVRWLELTRPPRPLRGGEAGLRGG